MSKTIAFSYEEFDKTNELPVDVQDICTAAKKATTHSYAPYSKFLVGAAAQLNDGTIIIGANLENASYPVGICAERVLLSNLLCLPEKKIIKKLAISYINKNGNSDNAVFPCGMCRQALLEQENNQNDEIEIYCFGENNKVIKINAAKDLLPLSFSFKDLI